MKSFKAVYSCGRFYKRWRVVILAENVRYLMGTFKKRSVKFQKYRYRNEKVDVQNMTVAWIKCLKFVNIR